MVRENLHLDMPGPLDQPLDVERAVAERRRRLAARALHRLGDLPRVQHAPHAFAASTGGRLDQHGQPDPVDGPANALVGLVVGSLAGNDRHAGRLHQAPRFDLGSHARDDGRRRADEDDAGAFARLGEAGVLREEAVARVHGIRRGRLDGPQDVRNRQIAVARRRRVRCRRRDRRPPRAARARRPPSRRRRSRRPAPGRRERCAPRSRRDWRSGGA